MNKIKLYQQNYKKKLTGSSQEQLTAPSPLQLKAISDTEIQGKWQSVYGADKYIIEIGTQSDYSDAIESFNDLDFTYTKTGLIVNTYYYWRVKSHDTTGVFADSDWVTGYTKTLSFTPDYWYEFAGIPIYGTPNRYGKTDVSPNYKNVLEVYNQMGATNTLTPGASEIPKVEFNDSSYFKNTKTAYQRLNKNTAAATSWFLFTNPVTISGDFTIIYIDDHITNTDRNLIQSTDVSNYISIRGNRIKAANATGASGYITVTKAFDNETVKVHVIKRVGTTLYFSGDNGATFSTTAFNADDLTFNELFGPGDVNAFKPIRFVIAESELTLNQINEVIDYYKDGDYSYSDTINPSEIKGIIFTDLVGDYITNPNFVGSVTGGPSWTPLAVQGNYGFLRLPLNTNAPYYGADQLYTLDIPAWKKSGPIDFGHETLSTDNHNVGSLFILDNTLYQIEFSQHYDDTALSYLMFNKFGKNFDLSAFRRLTKGHGFIKYIAPFGQYPQFTHGLNYKHIFYQEWDGSRSRWISLVRSKDDFNSFDKLRVADTGGAANDWFYHQVVYREDGVIGLIINYVIVSDKYYGCFYIESHNDGETWQNLSGSFSRSIINGQTGILLSELIANCVIHYDAVTAHSIKGTGFSYNPATGQTYGIVTKGDNTNLYYAYSDSGTWVLKQIDNLGLTIVANQYTDGGLANGVNTPWPIQRSANDVDFFLEADQGSDIWKIVKFQSDDMGDTYSNAGDQHGNLTNRHWRIILPHNLHYTGGTTAYNGKKLLIASMEHDGISDCLVKDIS